MLQLMSDATILMQSNIAIGMLILYVWSTFLTAEPILWSLTYSNPNLWLIYGTITTVASVSGGLIDYYIGLKAGRPILGKILKGTEEDKKNKIEKVEKVFDKYGDITILIAALTPVPYKLFCFFAGITRMKKRVFITWAFIGRGIRFYLGTYTIHLLVVNKALGEIVVKYQPIILGIIVIGFIIRFILKIREKIQ